MKRPPPPGCRPAGKSLSSLTILLSTALPFTPGGPTGNPSHRPGRLDEGCPLLTPKHFTGRRKTAAKKIAQKRLTLLPAAMRTRNVSEAVRHVTVSAAAISAMQSKPSGRGDSLETGYKRLRRMEEEKGDVAFTRVFVPDGQIQCCLFEDTLKVEKVRKLYESMDGRASLSLRASISQERIRYVLQSLQPGRTDGRVWGIPDLHLPSLERRNLNPCHHNTLRHIYLDTPYAPSVYSDHPKASSPQFKVGGGRPVVSE